MSKFKVGDKIRRKEVFVTYGEWVRGLAEQTVSNLLDGGRHLEIVGDDDFWDCDKFELVEEIKQVEPVRPNDSIFGPPPAEALLRQFESGATRNLDNNKLDYEGFLSPLVIEAFGKYMHSHRLQKDGTMRSSDNWQLGIGFDVYMKSGWRHFFDWWKLHRGLEAASPEDGHQIDKVEALCALMFNVQGYLHELLKEQSNE